MVFLYSFGPVLATAVVLDRLALAVVRLLCFVRAIFFCAAALSVTWCDLECGFLGGAMVAANANVAGSRNTAINSKL